MFARSITHRTSLGYANRLDARPVESDPFRNEKG
jgi:hypothetical protein